MAHRHIAILVLEQLEPVLLLLLGGHGEVLHRLVVDLLARKSVLNLRQQVAERKTLRDHDLRHAEGGGDFGHLAPFLDETHEGDVFGHRIGIAPRGILNQRGFYCRGVVARLHHRAGERCEATLLVHNGASAPIAPPPGDDFDRFVAALCIGPDQKRLQYALGLHGRQDVRHVRRSPVVTHIELGVVNVFDRDVTQFHGFIFLGGLRARPRAGFAPG